MPRIPGSPRWRSSAPPTRCAGEVVCAFVVRRDPALTEAAVRAFCRESLTAYKVPRVVRFRDDLPKSPVGKVLRKDLRDLAPSG